MVRIMDWLKIKLMYMTSRIVSRQDMNFTLSMNLEYGVVSKSLSMT